VLLCNGTRVYGLNFLSIELTGEGCDELDANLMRAISLLVIPIIEYSIHPGHSCLIGLTFFIVCTSYKIDGRVGTTLEDRHELSITHKVIIL